jgi:uncharacterized protein YjeT (DUF2065 family)
MPPRPLPGAGVEAAGDVLARVRGHGAGMSNVLWSALALVLIAEGVLPFLSPGAWRRLFEQALRLRDGQIRFIGLTSMLLGLILLYWVTS